MSDFIVFLRAPRQRNALIIIALAMAAVGVAMHALYPLPFIFPDSGAYVLSAADPEMFNIYRPMGYSAWLRLVHVFGRAPGVLFAFTWGLSCVGVLWAIFSAAFLLQIRNRPIFWLLAAFAVLAPRLIFSANFLMSDSLFCSLALLFCTSALWLVMRRGGWMLALHLLTLALLCRVRYAGVVLLPVSVAAVWLGWGGIKSTRRAALALIPVVLLGWLMSSARQEYAARTGVETSSGFGGWQLVNNASVLIPEAKSLSVNQFPIEQRTLHRFLASCPDSLFTTSKVMTTDLMWNNALPYKQYLGYHIGSTTHPYPQSWVEVGRLYGDYAAGLIRRYPGRYLTRYALPSLAGGLSCQPIYEEGDFVNQPLYAEWFGVAVERHEFPKFFAALTPLRRVGNVVFWLALLAAALVWACRIARRPTSRATLAAGVLLGFTLVFLVGSALGSPNTTWRYTMPLLVPALIFIAWAAQTLQSFKK